MSSLPAVAEEQVAPLTLDPGVYAEALREVQGITRPGESAIVTASTPGVEDWQAALRDAGTEVADVRLMVLLQRLNPQEPPAARAEDYAAVLHVHHLMLAGNARACLELARACREGRFESGLLFIRSEPLALVLERRAAAFQLPVLSPALPVEQESQEAHAPEGR